MVADRIRDGIGQAFGAGIVAAHKALQFGKLADHFGDQIGLGEAGGLFGHIGIGILHDALFDQPAGQLRHPVHLVGDRAELFVESDPLQPLGVLRESLLAIHVPEEARVGKPRRQDLAVAVHDRGATILSLDIRGADEGVGQFPGPILADEIFLVHPRGQLDDFGRNLEIRLIEAPKQRDRPFGEAGILDHQPLIHDQCQSRCAGDLRRAAADQVLPFLMIDDDMGRAQLDRVIVGATDRDVAAVVEPVAERDRAAGDAVDLAFDQLVPEQRDDARQRAHPAQGFRAERSRAPAHRFGPAEIAHDRANRLAQKIAHCAPRRFDDGEIGRTALDLAHLQLVARYARLAAKSLHSRIGRAFGRTLRLLAHRLGRGGKVARDQRKPAGGGPDRDLARRDTSGGHLAPEQLFQFGAGACLHPGGDFLAAQFEEEILAIIGAAHFDHSGYCSAHRGASLAMWASHDPRARSRTRPI